MNLNTFRSKRLTFEPFVFFMLLIPLFFNSCTQDPKNGPHTIEALMGNGWGIASASIFVDNLDTARKHFTDVLGFRAPRDESFDFGFIRGSRSSTIMNPDMSTIELVGPFDTLTMYGEDTIQANLQTGKTSHLRYRLSTSAAEYTSTWLKGNEFNVDSIQGHRFSIEDPEGWNWDDGGADVFRLGIVESGEHKYLPQFEQLPSFPYERMSEWNSFYNMQRGFLAHPNGVVGTSAILLQVDDVKAAKKQLLEMGLPLESEETSKDVLTFTLKRDQKIIVTANKETQEGKSKQNLQHLGMFGVRLEVENLDSTLALIKENLPESGYRLDSLPNRLIIDKEHTYGLQLEFVQESEEQAMIASQLAMKFRDTLSLAAQENAESMYLKYCSLCHGENREGYAADFAPSLRSKSLISTAYSTNFLRYTIQYGRAGTAMGGYYDKLGGPMEMIEIELLLKWLYEKSGVEAPIELSRDPVKGNIADGSVIYNKHCAACHGADGEGISAPALGNPMLLATATDEFLKYAITNGRDSSLMPAFKDSLSEAEIDNVTAFLRSRASGWDVPESDSITVPQPEDYVLNPDNPSPDFELKDGVYLPAVQLNKALQDSMKLILLDARSEVAWRQTHIPGAVPVPYYEEPEDFINDIPNDSTWVVAYCACPHAASQKVIKTLKRYGYEKTAILDEGILVWASMGFPVKHGG